jgi:hypothetical protein
MVRSIAEGIMMSDDDKLSTLAGAHVAIGLLAAILVPVGRPILGRLDDILIVPLIASSLSLAFLLALWGVTCTASLWKRIAGLVAGTVYLETLLVLALDSTILYLATATIAFTTAWLLVFWAKGFTVTRPVTMAPFAQVNNEQSRFSIRGLMLLIAVVAVLSASAKVLRAIPFPYKVHLLNNLFSICFVAVGFVALGSVLVKVQPFGLVSVAVFLSPVLGAYCAFAASTDGNEWIYIILTFILGSAAMIASFLVVRSCGYRIVSSHSSIADAQSDDDNAGETTWIGQSADEAAD